MHIGPLALSLWIAEMKRDAVTMIHSQWLVQTTAQVSKLCSTKTHKTCLREPGRHRVAVSSGVLWWDVLGQGRSRDSCPVVMERATSEGGSNARDERTNGHSFLVILCLSDYIRNSRQCTVNNILSANGDRDHFRVVFVCSNLNPSYYWVLA